MSPGHGYPPVAGGFEDWVMMPASDEEMIARAEALMRRWLVHRGPSDEVTGPAGPGLDLDAVGVLRRGDRWADLPPIEARLMRRLLSGFGHSVTTGELLEWGWDESPPALGALRVHVLRLRRRIAPLGLSIHALPRRGYMLTWADEEYTQLVPAAALQPVAGAVGERKGEEVTVPGRREEASGSA